MITPKIAAHTRECESCPLNVYNDSLGFPTIGWGHKLKEGETFSHGITQEQADSMFLADLEVAYLDAHKLVPNMDSFCEPRQAVIIDMSYNMGFHTFAGFHHFFDALKEEKWATAAYEMRNSKWYTQVKSRAVKNWNMMLKGEWQC